VSKPESSLILRKSDHLRVHPQIEDSKLISTLSAACTALLRTAEDARKSAWMDTVMLTLDVGMRVHLLLEIARSVSTLDAFIADAGYGRCKEARLTKHMITVRSFLILTSHEPDLPCSEGRLCSATGTRQQDACAGVVSLSQCQSDDVAPMFCYPINERVPAGAAGYGQCYPRRSDLKATHSVRFVHQVLSVVYDNQRGVTANGLFWVSKGPALPQLTLSFLRSVICAPVRSARIQALKQNQCAKYSTDMAPCVCGVQDMARWTIAQFIGFLNSRSVEAE